MARTVIVSVETARHLIEAHASMAAWYYQLSEALRRAGVGVEPPSDAQRRAHLAPLAAHFPELGTVVATMATLRPYVPPPAHAAVRDVVENEGVEVPPPPADHVATPAPVASPNDPTASETETGGTATPAPATGAPPHDERRASSPPVPAPPPLVDPNTVRYE